MKNCSDILSSLFPLLLTREVSDSHFCNHLTNPFRCYSSAIKDFLGHANFLCVVKESAEKATFLSVMPGPGGIKGSKAIIVVKTPKDMEATEFENIENEIVFMEINKPVLENLFNLCSVSFTNVFKFFCSAQFMICCLKNFNPDLIELR